MRECKEYEFGKDFMVYVIENDEQENCFNYQHYLDNKSWYKDKVLVICHKDIPVYFRRG